MELGFFLLLSRTLLVSLACLAVAPLPERPAEPAAAVLLLRNVVSTMQVDPPVTILRKDGANISHSGGGTLSVTITGDAGQVVVVEVPSGQTVNWVPPAGWRAATFTASGHQQEYRVIQ